MRRCCVPSCKNKYAKGIGLTFLKFPLDYAIQLEKWLIAINRKNFQPKSHHRICSDHFTNDCFYPIKTSPRLTLKMNVVPNRFLPCSSPGPSLLPMTEDPLEGTEEPDIDSLCCKIEVMEEDILQKLSEVCDPIATVVCKTEPGLDVPTPNSSVDSDNSFELILLPPSNHETPQLNFNDDPLLNIPFALSHVKCEIDLETSASSADFSSIFSNVTRIIESVSRGGGSIRSRTEKPKNKSNRVKQAVVKSKKIVPKRNRKMIDFVGRPSVKRVVKRYECSDCQKLCASKLGLIRHLLVHRPSGESYQCRICSQSFPSSNKLKIHSRLHYECRFCSVSFLGKKCLDKHLLKVHDVGKPEIIKDCESFECNDCNILFTSKSTLVRHVRSHINNVNRSTNDFKCKLKRPVETSKQRKTFECVVCDPVKEFQGLRTLNKHLRSHYKCTLSIHCSYSFLDSQSLENHENEYHNNGNGFTCEHCGKLFMDRRTFASHVKFVHGKQRFQCTDCDKSFAWSSSFKSHQKFHSGSLVATHLCSECGKCFLKKSSLAYHMQTHKLGNKVGQRPMYECDHCSQTYTRKEGLKFHIRLKHTNDSEARFQCKVCDKSYARPHSLRRHSSTHLMKHEHRFICSVCSKGFGSNYCLKCHLRTHTEERPYKCSKCPKAFSAVSTLKSHLARHEGGKPATFHCTICDKMLKSSYFLKRHTEKHAVDLAAVNVDDGTPFQCDRCDRSFPLDTFLVQHRLNAHALSTPKVYECKICGMNLPSSSELNYHTVKHSERKFQCTKCDKAFFILNHLNDHLKRHEEPKFKCKKCGLRYFMKRHLRYHKRQKHSGVKELFICNECNRAISSKESLVIHLRTHSGIRPFQCGQCDKNYTAKGALKCHMRTHQ